MTSEETAVPKKVTKYAVFNFSFLSFDYDFFVKAKEMP